MQNYNIKSIFGVAKIELNTMFYSPVAWLVLVIFAFQVGLTYAQEMDTYIHSQGLGYDIFGATSGLFAMTNGIFPAITDYLYLYIPLITMGLMSKEYSSGSIKLLYSSPIKNSSIIVGKFVAMMVYGLALMAVIMLYFIYSIIVIKDIDFTLVLSGMLGIYLLLCVYSSIGLFMSTLTSYQVVVAIGTLAVLGFLNYIGSVGQDIELVRDITYWLSLTGRVQDMIKGLICSEDVIYFITIVIFFLALCILILNSQRISGSKKIMVFKGFALLASVVVIAFVTSRPIFRFYVDTTDNQKNTLSEESIDILNKIDAPLTLKTYVNILGANSFLGMPSYVMADIEFYERYLRFKPKMKIEYIFYYKKLPGSSFEGRYPGKTDVEVVEAICKKSKIDFKKVKTYEQIEKDIDLSGENYGYVRVFERGDNGARSFLRVYGDREKLPRESEISVALKKLITKCPLTAFVENNTDRLIDVSGGRGFNMFSIKKDFRNSLVNQGFDVCTINLDEVNIPEEVSILVIADTRTPLSPQAMEKVNQYISKGGNLYILADRNRQESMAQITEPLGVKFEKGLLIEFFQDINPSIIAGNITEESLTIMPSFSDLIGSRVIMPTAVGINYDNVKDFITVPIVSTGKEAWSEMVTTDFVEYTPKCVETDGEEMKRYTTVLGMYRKIGDKEQRIVISGDSDCISDEEFSTYRPFNKANFGLISGPFRWLSNDVFPIFVTKANPRDDRVRLPIEWRSTIKMATTILPSTLLLIIGLFIMIRRQRG